MKHKKDIEGDIIALDLGEKRVGLARINSMAKLSEPLEAISVTSSLDDIVDKISIAIRQNQAVAVVVGLPRGLDGQDSAQTKVCRNFASKLKNAISVPVYLIDEAGTSRQAEQRIKNMKTNDLDSVAACIIVEDFINYPNKSALLV